MDSSTIIKSWKENEAIRAEFLGDFKRFLAYADACSKGLVRIAGDNKIL